MRPTLSQRSQERITTREDARRMVGLVGDGWEKRLVLGLMGRPDAELARQARERAATGWIRVHPVDIALMRRIGLDPAIAIMLATVVEVVEVLDLDDERTDKPLALIADGKSLIHAMMEPAVRWSAEDQAFRTGPLPGAALVSLAGAPLSSVLSIPGVDELGLRIRTATSRDARSLLVLDRTPLLSGLSLRSALEPK